MKFALVTATNRPHCMEQMLASAETHLGLDHFAQHIVVCDEPNGTAYYQWLVDRLPAATVLAPFDHARGFGGAIQAAWNEVDADVDFVFHLEDDFVFNWGVSLGHMVDLLVANPQLLQVALQRQPVNSDEFAAGGVVSMHPDWYGDRTFAEVPWLEHRVYFTTNPSLYPRKLLDHGWPQEPRSEGIFTLGILAAHEGSTFALLGSRVDAPAVTHIGARAGEGY